MSASVRLLIPRCYQPEYEKPARRPVRAQNVEATTGFEPVNRGFAVSPIASAGVRSRRIDARTGHLFRVRGGVVRPHWYHCWYRTAPARPVP